MALNRISDVTINSKNTLAGGYIYDVDVSIGFADEVTVIQVTLVNETGDFFDIDLSVEKPYQMSIGNIFKLNAYAVRQEIKRSSNGRFCSVTFWDGSHILDRTVIGLWKRMGDSHQPGLILVGKEIHPCDVDQDGVFTTQDSATLNLQNDDPCELRCPGDVGGRQNLIEGCLQQEITNIFDIKYNFTDLLNAIQGKKVTNSELPRVFPFVRAGNNSPNDITYSLSLPNQISGPQGTVSKPIKIKNIPANINNDYLQNYTGSLREVLRSWCSDFGWTFYWENDTLNFLDTRKRVKPRYPNYANLESRNRVRSIENTIGRGWVTHYAEQGIGGTQSQSCSEAKPYMLRCFNLRDLFGERYRPAWNSISVNDVNNKQITTPNILDIDLEEPTTSNDEHQNGYIDDVYPSGVDIKEFEKMCVLSYHNDILRRLYVIWSYYAITSSDAAVNIKNKWLDRFGQRRIINVFSQTSTDQQLAMFKNLKSSKWGIKSDTSLISPKKLETIEKWNGYFVAILRNPAQKDDVDLLEKQFSIEENLATNFIGRHWFRNFSAGYLGSNPQIVPAGEYYSALAQNVSDMPFANFGHTYKSNISRIVNGFITTEQKPDYRLFGVWKGSKLIDRQNNKKLLRSIIYSQRDTGPRWLPIKNVETSLTGVIKDFTQFVPEQIDISLLTDKEKLALVSQDGNLVDGIKPEHLPFIELWVFYPGQFTLRGDFKEHPNEEPKSKDQSVAPFETINYGLMSKSTVFYTFSSVLSKDPNSEEPKTQIELTLPAGASVLHDEGVDEKKKIRFSRVWADDDIIDFSTRPGYKVLVTETSSPRGFIPKTESTLVSPPPSLNVAKVEYPVYEINKGDVIKFLNQLTVNCELPPEQIAALHELLSANLNYSIDAEIESRDFTVGGVIIPSKLSIKDGLESVKVRVDSEGVYSTITIGNSLFTPPSNDFILKQLLSFLPASVINARRNPI